MTNKPAANLGPAVELPYLHDRTELTALTRDFIGPFSGRNIWKDHLRPQWLDPDTARIRVFNGGFEPAAEYTDWAKRHCVGVAAVRFAAHTELLAELHEPLPKKNPLHVGLRIVPALGKISVLSFPDAPLEVRQLDLLDPNSSKAPDFEELEPYVRQLHHAIFTVIPETSKYLKRYTEAQGRDDRADTRFSLPVFKKQPITMYQPEDLPRLRRLVWSAVNELPAKIGPMPNEVFDQEQSHEPYRAIFKDSTDDSVRQLRDVEGQPAELSPEDQQRASEQKAFAAKMSAEKTFDINTYLQNHPEEADEARRLGFIE